MTTGTDTIPHQFVAIMNLVDLATFKIKKCGHQHPQGLSPLHLECPFFHSRDDKRRTPFSGSGSHFAYSQTYLQDYYSTQMSSNMIEHLFHPNIYKTMPCTQRISNNNSDKILASQCHLKYCPYVHQREDLTPLEPFRSLPLLLNYESTLPFDSDHVKGLVSVLGCHNQELFKQKYQNSISNFKSQLQAEMKKAFRAEQPSMIPCQQGRTVNIKEKEEGRGVHVKVRQEGRDKLGGSRQEIREKEAGDKGWYTQYTYFHFQEKLPMVEDRYHQFKNYRDIVNNSIAPIVLKYIAAFLNSDGGVLYVGVDDSAVVQGFEMKQNQFDKFMLSIDGESRVSMLPPLMPHKYSIRLIPVINHRKGKQLWVLEVKVTPSSKDKRNKILTLYNRQAFMRMNASTQKLDAVTLIQYLRDQSEPQQLAAPSQIVEELLTSLEDQKRQLSLHQGLEFKAKVERLRAKAQEMLNALQRNGVESPETLKI